MSLLTPDSGLLFWMVIVFGIVFVILAKYGFPVITRMVDAGKPYFARMTKTIPKTMTIQNNRPLSGVNNDMLN